ncbi:hypothetical protein J1N35_001606 [Gossypium stocksii]|uniref:Putative plant transposon protein domain-containing protein n=1 Tax=Gossypium stocksii TaxID=47602 RepID=A0A9D3WKP5_9ROSI|nr:hypothetical protein J1N35_001606 [Gossypium stocksii]
MHHKRTHASAQIDESQSKFHYKEAKRPSVDEELVHEFYANLTSKELTEVSVRGIKVTINSNAINEFFELPNFENDEYSFLMSNIEPENLQEILEDLQFQVPRIHTCRREYLTPLAKVWFYFIRLSLMPNSHETTISLERMVLLYSILTRKTINVGKIILREIRNCVVRHSGPAYFPFTIIILCLKAKILANVKNTGYSQGTITDWNLYRIARDSVLQQRIEESEDPEEVEEDPTKFEPMREAEVPDKVEPMELEVEPDVKTSMFRTQSPCPDLRDELSKLIDIMQHMQWQQQAY